MWAQRSRRSVLFVMPAACRSRVVRAAGTTGKVILWVRDPTGTDTGEETLVTVYTRTGVITAQPVNVNGDPYLYVKDGRSSGM